MVKTLVMATIAINTSLSAAVNLNGVYLVGVQMPAAWDTANLTLQVSPDGATYTNVYDQDGNELTITAAASRYIIVKPSQLLADGHLKVRSGTSGTAVTQTAARSITLVVRPL